MQCSFCKSELVFFYPHLLKWLLCSLLINCWQMGWAYMGTMVCREMVGRMACFCSVTFCDSINSVHDYCFQPIPMTGASLTDLRVFTLSHCHFLNQTSDYNISIAVSSIRAIAGVEFYGRNFTYFHIKAPTNVSRTQCPDLQTSKCKVRRIRLSPQPQTSN